MSNLNQYNRRGLIKRSTISTEIPTIPGSGATSVTDHTLGGWLATDIYVGELFINAADDRIWMRSTNGIVELASVSGHSAFHELTDTPSNYSGSSNYLVAVNSAENGLEFIPNTTVTSINDLTDTPSGITNNTVLVGQSIGPEYIAQPYINTFNGLTDVSGYTGNAGALYRVNVTENGLETFDSSSVFVDLSSNQGINGVKTFSGNVITHANVTINDKLYLGSDYLDSINTDGTLSAATNTQAISALAAKTYIDDKVITAVGGSYVPVAGATTITGIKTFGGGLISDKEITANLGVIVTSGNVQQPIASYHYFGSESVDGSYRFFINPTGDLEIQKRESGTWVYKANF